MKKEYDFTNATRGAVTSSSKQRITIRIDADIIDHFKSLVEDSGGGNYQAEINAALRDHITGVKMASMVKQAIHEAVHKELNHAA